MDPTSLFFSRLRRLAVTLEAETESLQGAYQTRADHGDDDTERGMGAYHTLCTEVADLKGELRVGLGQQRSREAEASSYLAACAVMQRRMSEDILALRGHFEKYGYQAPANTHTEVIDQTPEPPVPRAEEEPSSVADEEGGATEGNDPLPPPTPPQSAPPSTAAQMRTPLLSDFGLSEVELRHILMEAHRCPEAPPMPVLSLRPQPSSLATPLSPALLLTPKCALRMEEEGELRTPQIKDFGLSEHALFHNDDSTVAPPPTAAQVRTPQLSDFGLSEEDLRHIGDHRCSEPPPMPALSLTPPPFPLTTPLSPAMPLTPKCKLRMEEDELRTPQMKDFGIVEHTLCLNNDFTMDLHRLATRPQPPPQPATMDRRLEVNNLTPEMPKMESMFSSTLTSRSARGVCESGDRCVEPQVYSSLDVDGPTQEFNLRTPRVRLAYQDPPTPEMPDLSSFTQDIYKLVSRAQRKKQSNANVALFPKALGKENRAVLLPLVVDSEFQSLPSYLRPMSLSSLNDSIRKINTAATAKLSQGEALQFQTEELKSIMGVGTTAPIFFLCLGELHRLEHVARVDKGPVYKLLFQH